MPKSLSNRIKHVLDSHGIDAYIVGGEVMLDNIVKDIVSECEDEMQVLIQSPHSPELGHRFRIAVAVSGATGFHTDGKPMEYTDSDYFDVVPNIVEVRAWNLVEALKTASKVDFGVWFNPPEGEKKDG